METSLTRRALEFATAAHTGQTRKFTGLPYITHPIAVAQIAQDIARSVGSGYLELEILTIIALLHDTVEDTAVTLLDIEALFSDQSDAFILRIVSAVDALTKREGETYLDAINRVMKNPDAVIVKRADLQHNSTDLKEGSLKDKYRLASFLLENFPFTYAP